MHSVGLGRHMGFVRDVLISFTREISLSELCHFPLEAEILPLKGKLISVGLDLTFLSVLAEMNWMNIQLTEFGWINE